MRSLALLALWLAIVSNTVAAPNALYGPISSQRISDHVRILASDAFEGRAPGTAGEDKTVAYLIQQFKTMGLKPGGVAGGWTQPLTVYRLAHASPIKASIRFNTGEESLVENKTIVANSTHPSGRVSVQNAPLIFVGHGIDAPAIGWDDFKNTDLTGKVAVMLQGEPDGEPFGGPEISIHGNATTKIANLLKRGAIGVLIVAPEGSGAWESRVNSAAAPQYMMDEQGPQLAFNGFIPESLAARAASRSGLSLPSLMAAARQKSFQPALFTSSGFSIDFTVAREKRTTRNVLARLPGTTRAGETLLFTAHWDHLGRSLPDVTGDDIYNGAIDNASGIGGLLELARAYAREPAPLRTMVFMATTGEELGFLGIRHYVEHPIYPLETTVADINMDTLSMIGPTRTVEVMGYDKTTMDEDQVPRFAKKQGRSVDRTPGSGGNYYNRADHIILARRGGVPALYLSWGEDRIDPRPVGDYIAEQYHRPNDEWSPAIDFREAAQNLELLYGIGKELANSGHWPEWKAGVEFKALRDQSAGSRRP